ncbi:phosphonate C-P lyase system protein PhnL [Xanthobacteraceae bacterium Astr-EGSB]|uniref:phosphonate C-P lyase system protein PhnL n=1 Tax=Astrobacterium formosum TaxID=3069710 RepID=UPI0027B6966B|nr:phosphonate C-P lyase system protein PhnL [Xanthobacteraceae bacterium Astr-EGSB]
MSQPILELADVSKTFTLHLQGGLRLPAVSDVTFSVHPGECLVLAGPSGAGKSSILKMIYGNYRCDSGRILVRHDGTTVDVARAAPREILALRASTLGYVSQFLRAIPRVAAVDVVAGVQGEMRDAAVTLLRRLNVSDRLHAVPPATFSGGEQQRVNIARGFLPDLPVLLLDEPTASLDARNRAVVVELVAEKKRRGVAIVAVVHDDEVRAAIADTIVDIQPLTSRAA